MAIPWLAMLRALPWATILANGPSIARAAERAVARARGTAADAPSPEITALTGRLAALEATQVELSELITRMAQQNERLAMAADVLATRLRWMTIVAAAASVLAVVSLVLVFVLR